MTLTWSIADEASASQHESAAPDSAGGSASSVVRSSSRSPEAGGHSDRAGFTPFSGGTQVRSRRFTSHADDPPRVPKAAIRPSARRRISPARTATGAPSPCCARAQRCTRAAVSTASSSAAREGSRSGLSASSAAAMGRAMPRSSTRRGWPTRRVVAGAALSPSGAATGTASVALPSTHCARVRSVGSPGGRTSQSWRTTSSGRSAARTVTASPAAPAVSAVTGTRTTAAPPAGTSATRVASLASASRATPEALMASVAWMGLAVRLRTVTAASTRSPSTQLAPVSTRAESGSATGTSTCVVACRAPSGTPTKAMRQVVSASPSGTWKRTWPPASVRTGGDHQYTPLVSPVLRRCDPPSRPWPEPKPDPPPPSPKPLSPSPPTRPSTVPVSSSRVCSQALTVASPTSISKRASTRRSSCAALAYGVPERSTRSKGSLTSSPLPATPSGPGECSSKPRTIPRKGSAGPRAGTKRMVPPQGSRRRSSLTLPSRTTRRRRALGSRRAGSSGSSLCSCRKARTATRMRRSLSRVMRRATLSKVTCGSMASRSASVSTSPPGVVGGGSMAAVTRVMSSGFHT